MQTRQRCGGEAEGGYGDRRVAADESGLRAAHRPGDATGQGIPAAGRGECQRRGKAWPGGDDRVKRDGRRRLIGGAARQGGPVGEGKAAQADRHGDERHPQRRQRGPPREADERDAEGHGPPARDALAGHEQQPTEPQYEHAGGQRAQRSQQDRLHGARALVSQSHGQRGHGGHRGHVGETDPAHPGRRGHERGDQHRAHQPAAGQSRQAAPGEQAMGQDPAHGLVRGAGEHRCRHQRRHRAGHERRAARQRAIGRDEGRELMRAGPDRAQALELLLGLMAHPADHQHQEQREGSDSPAGDQQQPPRGTVRVGGRGVQPGERRGHVEATVVREQGRLVALQARAEFAQLPGVQCR